MAQLSKLFLHENLLAELPEGIGQLAQLQVLWLQSNQLARLPDGMENLTQVRGPLLLRPDRGLSSVAVHEFVRGMWIFQCGIPS